ncbi:hypothetical protein [Paenibacillus sp. Leaf72]|uniref:hypothetical protein n=1 Tax=Paenibacillus sp. Leaf72 TaxID=1736234 RepID=UPI0006F50B86|nr:hypothetical protein [Paenibacillus sp. Leaf72]KQN97596.1 hypothetical protein ASF12_20500 [Paenibacillus sp. Leaf72]
MLKMKTIKAGYAVYIPRNNDAGRAIVERFLSKGIELDVRPLSQMGLRVTSRDPRLFVEALKIVEEWQRKELAEHVAWKFADSASVYEGNVISLFGRVR